MENRKIGLWISVALVVGNMIASGIFMLPAALAGFGSISFIGWAISATGALAMAAIFSELAKIVPGSSGGPYTFTKTALGDFPGFLVAWGYWLATCTTVAAITVAFLSYLSVFVPILGTRPDLAAVVGLATIWLLTAVNITGIKSGGIVQLVTTLLKVTPLVFIALIGVFYVSEKNFVPFNATGESDLLAVSSTITFTLFAFVGLESATIPSGNIKDPEKTIPRATMIGTIATIFIYVLGSFAVMGMIPSETLKNSNAPFADAAGLIWGTPGRYAIASAAVISTFGALNGWIMLVAQIPSAASKDNIFPRVFGKINKAGVPFAGIFISSAIISFLLLANFTETLGGTFSAMVLLSTMIVLIPYLFSVTSYGILAGRGSKFSTLKIIVGIVGLVFSFWALAGAGERSVYLGLLVLLAGLPIYVLIKRSYQRDM